MLCWLTDVHRYKVSVTTYARYMSTYEAINNSIGFYEVSEIDNKLLQDYINSIGDAGYSRSTIAKSYSLLKNYFDYLIAIRTIKYNPIYGVTIPSEKVLKHKTKKVKALSEEEKKLFLNQAFILNKNGTPRYRYRHLYVFMLNTGLRIGEVAALMKSDVDLEKRIVYVRHNISTVDKYAFCDKDIEDSTTTKFIKYIHEPKSETSVREIPLNNTAYEAAVNILNECSSADSEFFIVNSKGGLIDQRSIAENIEVIAQRAGIPKFGIHVFRHTFGSDLSNKGVPDREIADLMGHAYTTVTQKYVHKTQKRLKMAVEKLDEEIIDESNEDK